MKFFKNFWLIFAFLLIISLVAFRPYIGGQNSDYTTEIAAAALGTVLAAFVTFILLQSQSRSEESKEKGVAIYQAKLDAYNALIDLLERAMCEGQPKKEFINALRFQDFRTRFIAHEAVVEKLRDFSETYRELVADNDFSEADWDVSEEAVIALVNTMRADLEADRKGTPLSLAKLSPAHVTSPNIPLPQHPDLSDAPTQQSVDDSSFTPKTSKAEFLAQCEESERPFFEQILSYCESNPQRIIIEWGSKGFSVKDVNRRQVLWMFPKEGANSKSNINVRTQKYTPSEKSQVEAILRTHGILKGWSWRPADLPLSEVKRIINLICGVSP